MNKQSEKDIPVNLYKPYDDYNDITGEILNIARINPAQMAQLMNALEEKEIPQNACVAHLSIDVKAFHVLYRARNKQDKFIYHVHLEHMTGRNKKSPCTCPKNPAGRTKMTPLEKCATNIQNGECKCPFMADVIGRIILPELYTQKTK